MSTTETLLDLKVHKLSNESYESKNTAGSLDDSALYLTPAPTLVGANQISVNEDTENNKITFSIADGTTSQKGIVQLNDTLTSTSTTQAATANAVKKVSDKVDALDFTPPNTDETETTIEAIDTVSQTNGKILATKKKITPASTSTPGIVQLSSTANSTVENMAATPKGVQAAINALNVSEPTANGTSTTFIAKAKQVNGKIEVTKANLPNYAGSASQGGPANKVANNLTIKLTENASTEGTDKFTYDGSEAKTVTIKTTDADIKLSEALYTYAPIGKAQTASNNVIGSGSAISNTNPGKLGEAGDSLKSVFNVVFGTQQDQQPTISTSGVQLKVSVGTTSYGGGEYGTAVAATDVTITFTLANSATAQYGYRCSSTKTTTSNATFKYAITKQNGADIKITLPTGKTASSNMVTAGTYVSASSNILYCNFNNSNKVSIKIRLPGGSVSTSQQTRYGQISASVTLGAAQTSSGTTITKFLTYLGNDATSTTALSGGSKSNTAGPYTISAGSYYSYSKLDTAATAPTSGATRQSNSDCDNTYNYSAGKYLWLYSRSSGKKIQTYVAGSWADVTTSGRTSITLTLSSGGTATYYAYRTDKFTATGSARYRLA